MIYFSDITKISSFVSVYNNVVVVSGSDKAELDIGVTISKQIKSKSISIPSGEAAKDLNVVELLWNSFAALGVNRKSLIISVGGGAISDSVGFAASTFMRGVDFACVPTTLLAMSEASIGGKRAINITAGKNLVGSFYEAKFILIDESLLNTLSEIDYKSGMCEILKLSFLSGKDFVDIKTAIEVKQSFIDGDFEDKCDKRIALNYGHTLAHALETLYGVPHGMAVGVGMDFAAFDTPFFEKQRIKFKDYDVMEDILEIASLIDDIDSIVNVVKHDKKTEDSQVKFVRLKDLGKVEILPISMEQLKHNLLEYKRAL